MGGFINTEVRDGRNFIIGICKDAGNIIIANSFKKGFVGQYNKNTNITTDSKGKIYCYGDGTQSLIRDAER